MQAGNLPVSERRGYAKRLPPGLLAALQARAARVSLGPSSMRGPGNRGVVESGRKFLCSMSLDVFATPSVNRFRGALDDATDALVHAFPATARHWGLARKGLNIFLRECLYTVYLRDAHRLDRSEALLEVPLDALSGRALWEGSGGTLPRWQTVRGLTRATSDLARQQKIARVHLDAVWWWQRAG